MNLKEVIVAIKEENLSKSQLERLRDLLVNLFAEMQLEKATIEKEEALFEVIEPHTNAELIRAWRKTESGQRLIELDNHTKIVNKLYDSIKSRLYSLY